MTKELTAEEKAFFESGGSSDMPTGYMDDAKTQPFEEPAEEEARTETPSAETTAESEQPAAGDDATADGQPDGKKQMVPLATYMEEKKARQERDRRLEEMQANFARADERLRMIQELQQRNEAQQQQQQAPQIPTVAEDPMAALDWVQQQIIGMTQQREQEARQQQESRQQQQARQQYEAHVINVATHSVREYMQKDNSFPDALAYLKDRRYKEHLFEGLSPQAAAVRVNQDEMAFYSQCVNNRRDPASSLVEYAKIQGWAPKTADAGQANPSGTDAAADKLKAIAAGQAASVSPSTAGSSGNARAGKLDMKMLGEMTDKQFKEFLAKDSDGEMWRKVMGA